MDERFIVDWQEGCDPKFVAAFVSVRMSGSKAGLYRVEKVMQGGILLSHGAISFPIGTQLDIDDVLGILPGARQSGQVVGNDSRGMRIAWTAPG